MTDNNDAFPVETVLSDGSVFRVVPVDTGLRTIRAWAEHPWPMSPAQALALRDRLGWTSSPTDEEMFTTNHGIGEKDAWFIAVENGRSTRTVSGFHLSLTCRIPKPVRPEAVPIAGRAFEDYVQALTAVYGKGTRSRSQGVLSVKWALPNGASVEIGAAGRVVSVDVNSPALNEAARGEAQYFDEIADENDVTYASTPDNGPPIAPTRRAEPPPAGRGTPTRRITL